MTALDKLIAEDVMKESHTHNYSRDVNSAFRVLDTLVEKGYGVAIDLNKEDGCECVIINMKTLENIVVIEHKSTPMAICLAVEKLLRHSDWAED